MEQKDLAPGADPEFMKFWRQDHRPTINNILSISNVVVHYIWKAGQRSALARIEQGDVVTIPAEVPTTKEQMLARVSVLSDEMDANDEENRMMQAEIDALYAKIDNLD
jgi:hypothetical protein